MKADSFFLGGSWTPEKGFQPIAYRSPYPRGLGVSALHPANYTGEDNSWTKENNMPIKDKHIEVLFTDGEICKLCVNDILVYEGVAYFYRIDDGRRYELLSAPLANIKYWR